MRKCEVTLKCALINANQTPSDILMVLNYCRPYAVLTAVFYLKRTWVECFLVGKTKEDQKFQYQQSNMSYKSYIAKTIFNCI